MKASTKVAYLKGKRVISLSVKLSLLTMDSDGSCVDCVDLVESYVQASGMPKGCRLAKVIDKCEAFPSTVIEDMEGR